MAQEHDLFDDIIEISKGFDFLKNPLGGVTDALDPSAPQWNPADYKERPRGNTIPCLTCKNEKSGCTACMDVCPVNAIEVEEDAIEILDSCRKCGLCAAACPTEAIISPRLAPKNLYDDIVSAATSHETAYVTCTRALKRMPRENEVVVACVGDITAETWFSVLADYPNVSVYLPLGVCDKCRNTGGEDILGEAIATAEEWAGTGMGLEVDPKSLKCHKRREYERKEYMEKIARTTGLTVTKLNPATAALASVTQKLKAHRHQITQLERTLNTMCGTTTTKRRRTLTHGRQLVLSTLQNHPELAQNMQVSTPECDFDKCTSCGECVNVCPRLPAIWWEAAALHWSPRIVWVAEPASRFVPNMRSSWSNTMRPIWSSSIPRPRKRPPRRRRLTKKLRRSRPRQRKSSTRCSTRWKSSQTSRDPNLCFIRAAVASGFAQMLRRRYTYAV